MKTAEIINVMIYLATILFGFLAVWYRGNKTLSERVTALIAAAEQEYADWTKAGGEKMGWVVDRLYALIPTPIRPFIPRGLVENLVQSTFDAVEGYAKLQLDKLSAKAGGDD